MTKRVKYTSKPPWLSKDIEEDMHQRDKQLKAKKHEELKKQRNKVTSLLSASQNTYFNNFVDSVFIVFIFLFFIFYQSIWKATNTLTNRDTSKLQVTVKDLPPDKLNSHLANVFDTVIANDQSKLND